MSDAEDRQVASLLEQAVRHRVAGNWQGAIELLRRALAMSPEHARAHAHLALTLLGARRLAGAAIEAELALHSDANDAFCHYALAAVRRAERKLDEAWQHCTVALEFDTTSTDARVLGAAIRVLQGQRDAARALLDEALALAPDDPAVLAELARLALRDSQLDEATRWIDRALRAAPARAESHVVAGYIALRRGDVEAAESHARTALEADAGDRGALELWTAIKARRSVVLGLWWRFSAFVSLRSERHQLGILIGSFVAVRLAIIVAHAIGWEEVSTALYFGWLGFCAYTWVAPSLFRAALKRDLATVVLRDDY